MAILTKKSPCSTPEILEMTKEFPELCSGCSSGTHVVNAGLSLKEMGIVEREWQKSEFIWVLV